MIELQKRRSDMKKLNIILLILVMTLLGCAKKEEPNPEEAMKGLFKLETTTLEVTDINHSSYKDSIDFQFQYITQEKSGTLFGAAQEQGYQQFVLNYESIGVIHKVTLNFVNNHWNVNYSAADPEKKQHFDYTGKYIKDTEQSH